ncbi:hypothetical protein FB451DRAFT_1264854 [Mycena latifolia]|nr:hypothetical protein FB451DRAFT_1264854 [Mycena latifolia]
MESHPLPSTSASEDAPQIDAGHSQSTHTFFPHAQHFVVSGGTFTSIANYLPTVAPVSCDFRTISLADLDLRHELRLEAGSGLVSRRMTSAYVRKVYSARIEGRASDMTVAVYAGSSAETDWKQDLIKYSGLRHPNVVQVYAVVNSSGLYATVFHGDLVPIQQFFWLYRHSPISIVYLHGYFGITFNEVATYLKFISTERLRPASYIPWIRRSTGGLCIDLTPCTTEENLYPYFLSESLSGTPIALLGPDQESTIISALTLHHYHEICYWSLSRTQDYALPSAMPVHVGGIITSVGDTGMFDAQNPVEIGYLPECSTMDSGWRQPDTQADNVEEPVVMDNGWTRFRCSSPMNIYRTVSVGEAVCCSTCCWLAQANYILSRLHITSGCDDIVFVSSIHYELELAGNSFTEGYIFLCPVEHLTTEDPSQFCCPASPAYRSLDPSGRDGISSAGVAGIAFKTEIWGWSWDSVAYAGLRAFHHGKGFDPDSQDIALHLGLPLYQPSSVFV